jgi:asparagine synthetase B (glutamine-hydrolysing)
MCGIGGVVQLEGAADRSALRRSVAAMVKALATAAPKTPGWPATARRRSEWPKLAIRGCHDGRQPVVDAETGVMMVCNGEIDNHAELRAWAEARICSPRLEEIGIGTTAALALLREHDRRGADHGRALWTLIVVSEWLAWKACGPAVPSAGRSRDRVWR